MEVPLTLVSGLPLADASLNWDGMGEQVGILQESNDAMGYKRCSETEGSEEATTGRFSIGCLSPTNKHEDGARYKATVGTDCEPMSECF
jgi:hypothetical protein